MKTMSSSQSPSAPPHPPSHEKKTTPRKRGRVPPFRRNPFARSGERDNFPSIDAWLQMTPDKSERADEDSFFAHDDDCCDTASDILNMSIGARAALTDHLRYVAKHGIDREGSSPDPPTTSDAQPMNALDAQWDYLMDPPRQSHAHADTSTEISFIRGTPRARRSPNTSTCHEHSIDIMTEVSQDFFNSSRVHALATPERHRTPQNHVITRDERKIHGGIEEDDVYIDQSDYRIAPELLSIQATGPEEQQSHNSSLLNSSSTPSFCAPDISRISSADESEAILHTRSPESFFQPRDLVVDDGRPVFSPILRGDLASPGFVTKEHESFSTQPTSGCTGTSPPLIHASMFHACGEEKPPMLTRRCQSAPIVGLDKENFQLDHSHVPTKDQPYRRSALDTISFDFLNAIEVTRSEDCNSWSPVSQIGSGVCVNNNLSGCRRRRRSLNDEENPHATVDTTQPQDNSHSTTNSSVSLSGRKRFRTVVPRRVYMKSPSEFPEEHDSFGSVSRSGESSLNDHTPRSLCASFEAAAAATDVQSYIENGAYDY